MSSESTTKRKNLVASRGSTVTTGRDALKYLGILISFLAGIGQLVIGGIFLRATSLINSVEQLNYSLILISGIVISTLSFLALFRERLPIKISVSGYAFFVLALYIVTMFLIPETEIANSSPSLIGRQINGVGIAGILIIFFAIRPNFGPEANKRIYQAVAGISSFVIGIFMFILGYYIYYIFDIRNYAGNGTYPDSFLDNYLNVLSNPAGRVIYDNMITIGLVLMILTAVIFVVVLIRNKIGLLISSIIILVSNFAYLGCVIAFTDFIQSLNNNLYIFVNNEVEYRTQVLVSDPGVLTFGLVLFFLQLVAVAVMFYASFAAKPIDRWRSKRDHSIAAAEVATREGRLPQAVKYLEAAAMWSSKIDEEDKAIELLTRVRQIKDKAIKMRKSEAAQKAKKDYERQQKLAQRQNVKKSSAPKKTAPRPSAPPKNNSAPPSGNAKKIN